MFRLCARLHLLHKLKSLKKIKPTVYCKKKIQTSKKFKYMYKYLNTMINQIYRQSTQKKKIQT